MNAEFKRLTMQFSDVLEDKTFELLDAAFENREVDLGNVLNLVVSIHVSSMFNSVLKIAKRDKETLLHAKKYIKKFEEFFYETGSIEMRNRDEH